MTHCNINLITLIEEQVPQELLEVDRWVMWRSELTQDPETATTKFSKKPRNPHAPASYASHSHPATWGPFELAASRYENSVGSADPLNGLGLVFSDDDDLMGIDLDKCVDPDTGEVEGWALNIVERFETYAEVSPSGTGIKLWLYGTLPGERRRDDSRGIEMYDTKRFFTVTGQRLECAPRTVARPDPELLDAFYYSVFPPSDASGLPGESGHVKSSPEMSDEKILKHLRSDRGAEKFASAYDDGDLSSWDGNHSKADWYLAGRIGFYTQDAEQVERIFNGSALARRAKWAERTDYRERTINNMLAALTESYQPPSSKNGHGGPTIDTLIDRLVASERDRLCYSRSGWQRYEAGVWRTLERSEGQHVPYRVVRTAADAREFAYRWSLVNEVHNGAAIELAKSADIWDKDPDKLVFTNVTLNLKTFEPEPHNPLNYITAGVPYAYDPDATGRNWDRYLTYLREHPEVGPEVVDFLMEFLGYCLTADTSAEMMLFLVGEMGSGKSTFIEGAQAMLGSALVMTQSIAGLQQRFGRAGLVGKHLILSREMSALKLLETDIISNIVSGEPVRIEHKGVDGYDYTPVAKVIQAANKLPRVPNTEAGIYRRLKVIQFPPLDPDERDPQLKEGIMGEGPYILNTALAGLKRLRIQGGFTIPARVEANTAEWRSENDIVGLFFDDCIEDGTRRVPLGRIHELYKRWCEMHNYKALALNVFGKQAMDVDFYKAHHARKANRSWLKEVDLTDEGHHVNESGLRPIITYAEL
jgi:putative DNA primase/helicase